MCLHMSGLPVEYCTRCTPLARKSVLSTERLQAREPRRTSLLPSRFIPKVEQPQPEIPGLKCVGCNRTITNPGLCYTGSVLSDPIFTTILKKERYPGAIMESFIPPERTYVLRWDTSSQEKKVSFRKRIKGTLCSSCSSCIIMVEVDKQGNKEPLVITDPRPGFRDLAQGTEGLTSKPSFKGLNTRFVQGRRGSKR